MVPPYSRVCYPLISSNPKRRDPALMRQLFHLWLSPGCRMVRLALAEKGLECSLEVEPIWQRRDAFLNLNPAGDVPVLVDDNQVIVGGQVICEYLEECYPDHSLLGQSAEQRAEVRRIADWFNTKFHNEVTRYLVDEKVMKRFMGLGTPNAQAIKAGLQNIGYHLDYIGYLADSRSWLAGDDLSLADLAAAAHLSCVDYLGDVPWGSHESAKNWYARIKSRPTFRALLQDRIGGLKPAEHYHDLDF